MRFISKWQKTTHSVSKSKVHGRMYHEWRKENYHGKVQKTRQNICTEKGIIKKSGNCSDQQRQDRYHRAKAKEVQKIVDGLIALAVKEKDNFETVKVTTKVARKDKDGKRVKQIVDKETGKVLAESHRDKDGKLVKIENGVTVTVYDEVEKEIKKDLPTRSHARRQMLKVLNPVVEVPADAAGKKKNTKEVDLVAKLFDEYAPKYATRKWLHQNR